ncbi:TMAO reductase system periplasmic protein TorT [Ruicaihuangia caeni]|uniref:TMAO reductase system periplasmic protein TorT n=1 Tax=Ruicaihuangia caeni TaxID=3042517 RepID=A0AAW6T6A6_9MICO|nr:TMAO reductase system periplasmic protein TorT [Klugiella sp. YN-L-19]MDI2099366.1 TMAO reductase system periplasmic protein TorT [Klugiella sp. YN-L-19]
MQVNVKTIALSLTLAVATVAALASCGAAGADTDAAPPPPGAETTEWTIDAEFVAADGSISAASYAPIDPGSVSEPWKVCALFPHVKDVLWVSANYGNAVEAERLGIEYNLFEAGGYGNLSTQVSQTDDCIVQGFDALILGAISAEGNCSTIEKALEANIVVVDFINGTNCGESVTDNPLYTRVSVSYHETSELIGRYLAESSDGAPLVASFPGPDGAAFANDAVDGFATGIDGSAAEIEVERRGDTGLDVQLALIEDVLRAYPDVTDIFGVDIAAEAGVVALRNAGRSGEVGVYGYTIIPNLYQAIVDGDATAAVTDWTPFQGRMAISQAIKALEGQELGGRSVGPTPLVVSSENAASIEYERMFGPKDFAPVYSVRASR